LFLIPGGFYLALLAGYAWVAVSPRKSDQFDPNYQQAFRDEVLAPIMKYYFRGDYRELADRTIDC